MPTKYTGRAENLRLNERGIAFDVVVVDSLSKEIFRRHQWVSTGVMTGTQAKEAVKNVVERITMDLWAHIEGAKEAMTHKPEIDSFTAVCDKFIPTKNRPSPESTRGGSFASEV